MAKGKVDDAVLLGRIAAFIERHIVCTRAQRDALTLWIVHTHAFEAANTTPYLWITAPEIESGKTLLLETLELLVPNAWLTGRVTVSSLVRLAERPTLLLDESDVAFKTGGEYTEVLRGVLNSGYRKRSAKYTMSVPTGNGDWRSANFNVWFPKAIAGLGGQHAPDSVLSRSIQIKLKRKLPSEDIEPLYDDAVEREAAAIQEQVKLWVKTHGKTLLTARPQRLAGLGDRAFEIWMPLFAIADVALGEWPERARDAALSLSSPRQANVQSIGIQLLSDIRSVVRDGKRNRFSSEWLVGRLKRVEGSPWSDFQGNALTKTMLARLLRPYEIEPRAFNTSEEGWFRGYARTDFEDVFARYLPPLAVAKGKKRNSRNTG